MHIPRRHLNYANVVATFALVFAMSGGALAAKHYLINSTKQINPKVLKKLKGNTGKTGPAGPAGALGAQGKEGSQGKEGKEGAAGTARAYAYINAAGEVSHAKNITTANVTLAGASLVCLHGLSFTPENVVASPTFPEDPTFFINTNIGDQGSCPSGTQVTIGTYSKTGGEERGDLEVMIN